MTPFYPFPYTIYLNYIPSSPLQHLPQLFSSFPYALIETIHPSSFLKPYFICIIFLTSVLLCSHSHLSFSTFHPITTFLTSSILTLPFPHTHSYSSPSPLHPITLFLTPFLPSPPNTLLTHVPPITASHPPHPHLPTNAS